MAFDDDEVDFHESGLPEHGLTGYVQAVAAALGLQREACCCEVGQLATAYVALDGRLPGFDDHDAALLWDEETGWSAAVEIGLTDEPIVLCYLGDDVLPRPGVVRQFVGLLMAGQLPGHMDQPRLRCHDDDDALADRLSRYGTGGLWW